MEMGADRVNRGLGCKCFNTLKQGACHTNRHPYLKIRHTHAKLVRNLLNQVITDASGKKWPLPLNRLNP
ncbi:hypothetical protein B9Z34_00255 [Limnohabitans sp. Hippo3]|nr:hypothetical protein B9Z34_00255 [Limnohabitans sp. Hippo3]